MSSRGGGGMEGSACVTGLRIGWDDCGDKLGGEGWVGCRSIDTV